VAIANEAALILIEILKEPCKCSKYSFVSTYRGKHSNAQEGPSGQEHDDLFQNGKQRGYAEV
jgi:hypothetical protein